MNVPREKPGLLWEKFVSPVARRMPVSRTRPLTSETGTVFVHRDAIWLTPERAGSTVPALVAWDLATGDERARIERPKASFARATPVGEDIALALSTPHPFVHRVDGETGRLGRTLYDGPWDDAHNLCVTALGEMLVIGFMTPHPTEQRPMFHAMGARDGVVKWHEADLLPRAAGPSRLLAFERNYDPPDGLVVEVGLSAEDGSRLWSRAFRDIRGAIGDDWLCAHSFDVYGGYEDPPLFLVSRLDPDTGDPRWNILCGAIPRSIAWSETHVAFVDVTQKGEVFRIHDAVSGKVVLESWTWPRLSKSRLPFAIDGSLFLWCDDDQLAASPLAEPEAVLWSIRPRPAAPAWFLPFDGGFAFAAPERISVWSAAVRA